MSRLWVSIDPAKGVAAVAVWSEDELLYTKIIKPMGGKGRFYFGREVVDDRYDAWQRAIRDTELVVMEKGAGGRMNIVNAQGFTRGYIAALCESLSIPHHTVNVSEWRRVIKEAYDISWPQNRERKKAQAVKLVKEHYGLDVTDDEADAVLLGHAAMRMGLV